MEGFGRLVVLVDGAGVGPGQLAGARHDGLEHRVQIEGRAERPADIAERPKLAHRARQVLGPGFEFLEQADVLDGDHRLVPKGPEQSDLFVAESLRVFAKHSDRADGETFPEHRHDQDAPVAEGAGRLKVRRPDLGVLLDVGHVNRRAVEDRAAREGAPIGSSWEHVPKGIESCCRQIVVCDEMEAFSVELEHRAEETVAQLDRAADDRVKHGLDVGWRAADHPEDLARGGLLLQRLGHLRVGLVSARFFSSSSVNSRTFSIAITAWSAKVSQSAICLSVNGSGSRPADRDDAQGVPPQEQHRYARRCCGSLRSRHVPGASPGSPGPPGVLDVDRGPAEKRPTRPATRITRPDRLMTSANRQGGVDVAMSAPALGHSLPPEDTATEQPATEP